MINRGGGGFGVYEESQRSGFKRAPGRHRFQLSEQKLKPKKKPKSKKIKFKDSDSDYEY